MSLAIAIVSHPKWNLKNHVNSNSNLDPIVIGGSSGSGTRVFSMACIAAGYNMGTHLNHSYDAMDFTTFYDDWINRYLLREEQPLSSEETNKMNSEFQECLLKFRVSVADGENWGWKKSTQHVFASIF